MFWRTDCKIPCVPGHQDEWTRGIKYEVKENGCDLDVVSRDLDVASRDLAEWDEIKYEADLDGSEWVVEEDDGALEVREREDRAGLTGMEGDNGGFKKGEDGHEI